jgi:uncharacterized iron-regulated membrane protein
MSEGHTMPRERTKRIYMLHAWVGVLTGLFLFVVSLSGIFALFGAELRTWEDPNLRLPVAERPVPVNPLMASFVAEQAARGEIAFMRVDLPAAPTPYYESRILLRPEGGKSELVVRRWNAATGARLPERGEGLSVWLVDFHTDLMMPSPIGRYLVGLAGIIMLLSAVTGLLTHQKLVREAFTWRLDRSVRLKWQDSHKALGLWGAPFHLMIAFTGAILGLASLFALLVGIIAFKGDADSVREAVLPPEPPAANAPAQMAEITRVAEAAGRATGGAPQFVSITHWGDQNAIYKVYVAPPDGELIRYAGATASGASGEITGTFLSDTPGLAGRVFASMTPLHYATYGGIALKFLYTALGAALCVLIATGLMMWLERRTFGNEGRLNPAVYRALSRLTIGVTAGLCLASIAIFYSDKLLPVSAGARLFTTGAVFFVVWIVATIAAFIPRNEYMTTKAMIALFGLALMGLPAVNALATGDHLFALLSDGHVYAAGVDLAGLAFGAVVLFAAYTLPARRPERKPTPPTETRAAPEGKSVAQSSIPT